MMMMMMITKGSLSNVDDERGHKSTGLDKTKLCTCITLFYLSLPSLHDHNVKLANFTFSGGRSTQQNYLEFNSRKIHQHLTY